MKKYKKKIFELFSGIINRETLVVTVIILATLLMFHGIIDAPAKNLQELLNYSNWIERKQPRYLDIFIGGLVNILIIMFMLYDKNNSDKINIKKRLPDIAGSYWHYSVTGSDSIPSHNGKCEITLNNENIVRFDGFRCHGRELHNNKYYSVNSYVPWYTTWTDYGEDGWLRCEYTISGRNGYFKIHFNDYKTSKDVFKGTYYLLLDSSEYEKSLPNAVYGTIYFQRVTKENYDNVLPLKDLPSLNK